MEHAEETLREILTKVTRDQGYEKGQTSTRQITTGGANYTSLLYLATISETDKDDLKLFVKIAAAGEALRKTSPNKIFETENFAYTKLLEIFKGLEKKHNVPIEQRLRTPKFYGCSEVYLKEALVIEDLTQSGYKAFNRFNYIDWEYACGSVENLAKFHALSILWSMEDPDTFNSIEAIRFDQDSSDIIYYLQTVVTNALTVTKEEYKDRLSKFMDQMMQLIGTGNFYGPIRRPVISHGDYRPSNLMHKVKEDGTVHVISVDYQTLLRGNPIIDLMYFIFNGSDKKFRENHFRQILDHYYTELCAALQRLELDPNDVYPKDDFEYELEQILPYGLVVALFSLLFITVDEQDAPKINKDISFKDLAVHPNALYTERINDLIDDCINMGIL